MHSTKIKGLWVRIKREERHNYSKK
jgi:hypothetical protein